MEDEALAGDCENLYEALQILSQNGKKPYCLKLYKKQEDSMILHTKIHLDNQEIIKVETSTKIDNILVNLDKILELDIVMKTPYEALKRDIKEIRAIEKKLRSGDMSYIPTYFIRNSIIDKDYFRLGNGAEERINASQVKEFNMRVSLDTKFLLGIVRA